MKLLGNFPDKLVAQFSEEAPEVFLVELIEKFLEVSLQKRSVELLWEFQRKC